MNRAYHKWFSAVLQRDMELLIFGHAGRPVIFFPTRMARFYDYENWRVVDALKDKIAAGELQLFCVDSIDAESFYNRSVSPRARIERHLQYEQYILQELIPFIQKKNKCEELEIAGCSMGAYHAVNMAMKYPQLFKKVVGMSGRYDLTQSLPYFNDLFDGYHSDDVYFNMPRQYMANLADEAILDKIRHMEIILAIGETDHFLHNNQDFSNILWHKGIANQLYIWHNEAHRPYYWRQMVRLYL